MRRESAPNAIRATGCLGREAVFEALVDPDEGTRSFEAQRGA
jgi:hypothetical protein